MSESTFMRRVMLAASKLGMRLFRFNVGTGWQGKRLYSWGGVPIPPTHVLLADARVFHAGPPPGFSDLAGLIPYTVTADDIGRTLGVFTAVETKSARGPVRAEQQKFIAAVRQAGGFAGVAREGCDINETLREITK